MFEKLASKLTKPKTPESLDDLMAKGARLQFNFPVKDAQGRVMSAEEVKEMHRASARAQIQGHERTIEKAAGLRSLEDIAPDYKAGGDKTAAARKHWELMKRRYFGGMAEMPDVEQAQHAFNVAVEAGRDVGLEYAKVKAADAARAEIERICKEFNV
ncbi:outer membrane protein TolC [Paraburkholderia sp. MM5496-R1]|uniref:hypothetical protein n=1 Tax=Paraburkholderia sp. MM5496-R1 TaxID=2991065 RepID=UPI003D1E9C5B